MNVTMQDIKHLVGLSCLEPDEGERAQLQGQLEAILACMHTLDSIELSEDMEPADGENVLREDICVPGAPREQLLANAPEQDGEYILVPRAVE